MAEVVGAISVPLKPRICYLAFDYLLYFSLLNYLPTQAINTGQGFVYFCLWRAAQGKVKTNGRSRQEERKRRFGPCLFFLTLLPR